MCFWLKKWCPTIYNNNNEREKQLESGRRGGRGGKEEEEENEGEEVEEQGKKNNKKEEEKRRGREIREDKCPKSDTWKFKVRICLSIFSSHLESSSSSGSYYVKNAYISRKDSIKFHSTGN